MGNLKEHECVPDGGGGAVCGNAIVELAEICDGNTDTQSCWTGAAANRNVGICHDGTKTRACYPQGSPSECSWQPWGSCTGQQLPIAEICSNSLDDDCDGVVNDGCAPPPSCGNGQIDPGEQCDGSNLNGQTCVTLGHDGGTLSCTSCAFNEAACTDDVCAWPQCVGATTYCQTEQCVLESGQCVNQCWGDAQGGDPTRATCLFYTCTDTGGATHYYCNQADRPAGCDTTCPNGVCDVAGGECSSCSQDCGGEPACDDAPPPACDGDGLCDTGETCLCLDCASQPQCGPPVLPPRNCVYDGQPYPRGSNHPVYGVCQRCRRGASRLANQFLFEALHRFV